MFVGLLSCKFLKKKAYLLKKYIYISSSLPPPPSTPLSLLIHLSLIILNLWVHVSTKLKEFLAWALTHVKGLLNQWVIHVHLLITIATIVLHVHLLITIATIVLHVCLLIIIGTIILQVREL